MLAKIFAWGLDALALVTPVSIAATNIVFFPVAALWLLGGRRTLSRWPPVWGVPEKIFCGFLVVSLASALCGLDPRHSLKEIVHKDWYLIITIVVIALVRGAQQNARLFKIFMAAGLFTALFGILQYGIGINQTDKSHGVFLFLPPPMAHWPRSILDLLSLLYGRAMGTRGHPLAYAECLLFNWSFAISFLLSGRERIRPMWVVYIVLVGAALLLSQSRGPWIAAAIIVALAMVTPLSRRSTWLMAICGFLLVVLAATPLLRQRTSTLWDRSFRSNTERVHMWRTGWALWKSHPLLGIGPGSVKAVSFDYQNPDERLWGKWGHLHSTYINFLAERGAAGLLVYLAFIGSLFWELGEGLRQTVDPYKAAMLKGTLLSLVGYLIGGLTETSYNTAVVSMTLYFVLGLALGLMRHEKEPAA